jgi:hypothetical protein
MRLRKFVAAAAAIGLVATPTLAAASTAPAPELAPATETLGSQEQEIYGASIILQLGILLVVAAAIYFGIKALDGGDDEPASP